MAMHLIKSKGNDVKGLFKGRRASMEVKSSSKMSSSSSTNSIAEKAPPEADQMFQLIMERKGDDEVLNHFKALSPAQARLELVHRNRQHQNILHLASEHDAQGLLKLLLSQTELIMPLINDQDLLGFTPLLTAAAAKRVAVCRMLLQVGADPNVMTNEQTSALHYLIRVQPTAWNTEIEDLIRDFIAMGADIEAPNKFGESSLQQAASRLNVKALSFLLTLPQVKVNSVNKFEETALHKVVRFVNGDGQPLEAVKILLAGGADPFIKGVHGEALDVVPTEVGKAILAPLFEEKRKKLAKTDQLLNLKDLQEKFKDNRRFQDSNMKIMALVSQVQEKRSARGVESPRDQLESELLSDFDMLRGGRSQESLFESESSNLKPSSPVTPLNTLPIIERTTSQDGPRIVASPSSVREEREKNHQNNNDNPIIQKNEGYIVELGKGEGTITAFITIEQELEFYALFFWDNRTRQFLKHHNYLGYTVSGDKLEPAIISVKDAPETNGSHKTLHRSPNGVVQCNLPSQGKLKNPAKDFLSFLKTETFPNSQLFQNDDVALKEDLLQFEQNDPQRTTCFPVGVVFAREGQYEASEMWHNKEGSPAFNEFLDFLGDKIETKGWSGYSGGLDVVNNTKGTHSYYNHWRDYEIMFHVSTLLPYIDWDEHKLSRSRVIGNDVVNIIFQESLTTSYIPTTMKGGVSHVFIVIQPHPNNEGKTMYRVGSVWKDCVPMFSPTIPSNPIFEATSEFRDFLLAKIINGHLSAQRSPGLSRMYTRPREYLLEELIIAHVPEIKKQKDKESETLKRAQQKKKRSSLALITSMTFNKEKTLSPATERNEKTSTTSQLSS